MNKYPNGYLPKIQFWLSKYNEAIVNNDWNAAEYAIEKVAGFTAAQNVKLNQTKWVDGKVNTIAGVDFSESMKQLNAL